MDDNSNTIFRDVILLALSVFVVIVVMLLPFIAKKEKSVLDSPSAVAVEVRWPYEQDIDIDTWVMTPDGEAVGYNYKNGLIASLPR